MAAKIRQNDILITYISSGISAISDIRIVTSSDTAKLPLGGDYDTAYPIALQTEPVAVLERNDWIGFSNLAGELSLTRGKTDWRQTFRQSLIPLSRADGALLVSQIEQAKKNKAAAP